LLAGGPWLSRRLPGNAEAGPRSIDAQVRVLDIMPSLLELAGLPSPDLMQGQSFAALASPVGDRTSFAEALLYQEQRWSMRTPSWKTILNIKSRSVELYDVTRDPLERVNLVEQRPALAEEHKRATGRWHLANRAIADQLGAAGAQPLSPEQRERLRSLGYIR
jgi:arylsulfatase A-like enzyme